MLDRRVAMDQLRAVVRTVLDRPRPEGESQRDEDRYDTPHVILRSIVRAFGLASISMRIASARAALRLAAVGDWLRARDRAQPLLVVGATLDAAAEAIRAAGGGFGWQRITLGRLAAELALEAMAAKNLAPAGELALEAMCARVVHRLRGTAGPLEPVIDQPGLPRALARSLRELRMNDARGLDHPLDLLGEELQQAGLADRATVFQLATAVAQHPLLALPTVMIDVPLRSAVERRFADAILARAPSWLAVAPDEGDDVPVTGDSSLARVQRHLFGPPPVAAPLDDSIAIFSAPGESRECIEIARRILRAAHAGTPFDRMAVLLHAPQQYRVHLEEALGRANIPAHFESGTVQPDPSGRAFASLLACATEGLSAARFAEYLSLGELPDSVPPARRAGFVAPDEELLPRALVDDLVQDPTGITLRAPRHWEQLLVEAAVIGGRERWTRRLNGLRAQMVLDREHPEKLAELDRLIAFATPLLDDLAALPELATWGAWCERLGALATRALRTPERVLAVLAALEPMRDVGPIPLSEAFRVLSPRLVELVVPAAGRRYGKVLVAGIDAARGLSFDAVFVPGLAERMFPQKLVEDPLLPDRVRAPLGLPTRETRLGDERLALRIAIGAATQQCVLSYPRIDLFEGRPRVPSFYGLEVLAAAEGRLPGFDELARRADSGAVRVGWPAPVDRMDAIDEAEHDLVLLQGLIGTGEAPKGAATYLLEANPHLARALRFRARRWSLKKWMPADGLIADSELGKQAIAKHGLDQRAFSPTALEQLSACPYRFVLKTVLRLEPREAPVAIEELGPLERGSLIHQIQFELLSGLRDDGQLPVTDAAFAKLDVIIEKVALEWHDKLAPAIERVWTDGVAQIRADLREWLRRTIASPWLPFRFELAFGMVHGRERDPHSVDAPVRLPQGISLRGSIDLVEQLGDTLRATDHKSGKVKVTDGDVIAGGGSLQPALYALVLEQLFPQAKVSGGRLSYCTSKGDFTDIDVPLDTQAREAIQQVADTLADGFARGFFPAAPAPDACRYCDFVRICGPYEEKRTRNKHRDSVERLVQLRRTR